MKQMKFTPSTYQEKAILLLEKYGFKQSKFIRLAVEEKLHRDFRTIYTELKKEKQCKGDPSWLHV